MKQVDDWREYVNSNVHQVRGDLVEWAKTKDHLRYSTRAEPCNYSRDFLSDPQTVISFQYKIVIGRSSLETADKRRLRGRFANGHDAQLISYDRLLECANQRYKSGPITTFFEE